MKENLHSRISNLTHQQLNNQTIMWKEEDNKLKKTFRFKNFVDAFAFMTKVAIEAERMNHHPWWANVYDRVEIELSTHDAGDTVTDKDRKLAGIIDGLTRADG